MTLPEKRKTPHQRERGNTPYDEGPFTLAQQAEPVAIAEGTDLFWITGKEPTDDASRHLYYAAPTAPAAVPPGYVLVPIEPTLEMEQAADEYATRTLLTPKGIWWWGNVYRAMIAAAGEKP